jgi:penicillin G amidase
VGPSIFYKWLKFAVSDTLADDIPAEAMGNMGRSEVAFPFLLNTKKSPIDFYDDKTTPDVNETKDMILAKALNDAVKELQDQLGPDMAQWRWGRLHHITLGHDLGGEFNVGPFESDGGMDSVNVADFGLLGGDFNFGNAPSMRMTVELKPGGVHGENVIAGGQSGDRLNPNYSDQMPLWLEKKTHPMWFKDAEIKKNMVNVIVIRPK